MPAGFSLEKASWNEAKMALSQLEARLVLVFWIVCLKNLVVVVVGGFLCVFLVGVLELES